jgi:GMP synthase-like glutamine amidotransferase
MPRAIVLQHVAHEDAGLIGEMLAQHGYQVQVRLLHAGDAVPQPSEFDALVVMGGPMGVGDLGDARFPFLHEEVQLLRRILPEDRPVLGICLGAQLIAHAAGARVYGNHRPGNPETRVYEVGWGPLRLLRHDDAALSGLPDTVTVLHWHGDTFTLPPGAIHLAATDACPHQMFRLGRRCYAMQFHIEVDAATIAVWLREDAAYVTLANGPAGAARIAAATAGHLPAFRMLGERMLGNIIAQWR